MNSSIVFTVSAGNSGSFRIGSILIREKPMDFVYQKMYEINILVEINLLLLIKSLKPIQ